MLGAGLVGGQEEYEEEEKKTTRFDVRRRACVWLEWRTKDEEEDERLGRGERKVDGSGRQTALESIGSVIWRRTCAGTLR